MSNYDRKKQLKLCIKLNTILALIGIIGVIYDIITGIGISSLYFSIGCAISCINIYTKKIDLKRIEFFEKRSIMEINFNE